jgi:DNA-binding CsgD family transcriptional regulator
MTYNAAVDFVRATRRASLQGRRAECDLLDGLVARVRAGESHSLLLRGEAGIGKTALLDYAVAAAANMPVVRAVGVESEMELAYASLHQLCAPLFDRIERLPAPQREALEIVFGVSDGAAPDRFLVGLAALSLLSEAADEGPLLCVVDDAQWLDRASALTLGFVSRRLLAEPVGFVFAARDPGEELQHVTELEVAGLNRSDARALLKSSVRFMLDDQVRDRVIAETRGNPLALLELPRGLTASQLAGGFGLEATHALSGRIEQSYVQRLDSVSSDARRLLLVAAAEPVGDPLLLWDAAERLGIARTAVDDPEAQELLVIDDRVRFRHPLVRSAVYGSAAAHDRRAAHFALAEATDRDVDPDRRAWHLAAASAGPDEEVALELEHSAGRAQARGGLAAAAAFRERAVALTPEPAQRAQRALVAAQTKFEAGSFDDALALLGLAQAGALDTFQRSWVELLRAQIAFASRRGSDVPPMLLKVARDLEGVDGNAARAVYLEAVAASLFAGRLLHHGGVEEVSEAALAGPPAPDPPGASDLLLQGLATRFTAGYAAAAPILKDAVEAFGREDLPPHEARWLWLAGGIAWELWDDESWTVLLTKHLELVRAAGALMAVPFTLAVRSAVHAFSGELEAAAALIDEIDEVAEATGIAAAPHASIWLAGVRGREKEFLEFTEPALSAALARQEGFVIGVSDHARAVLYNGLGRYEEALAAARDGGTRAYEMDSSTTLVELIEAAARSGERELAEDALARLAETTQAVGTDWALGVEARSRALLSDGDAAERLYQEAIERLERTRIRVALARARLLYGEWLRREGRRVDAREQLRAAHELFAAFGMEAFTDRAGRELLATGEKVRKRSADTRDELTSQERQIARLALEGQSNPEIGARLFLSPRTVEWHLHKVFQKLGIHSRQELRGVMGTDAELSPA